MNGDLPRINAERKDGEEDGVREAFIDAKKHWVRFSVCVIITACGFIVAFKDSFSLYLPSTHPPGSYILLNWNQINKFERPTLITLLIFCKVLWFFYGYLLDLTLSSLVFHIKTTHFSVHRRAYFLNYLLIFLYEWRLENRRAPVTVSLSEREAMRTKEKFLVTWRKVIGWWESNCNRRELSPWKCSFGGDFIVTRKSARQLKRGIGLDKFGWRRHRLTWQPITPTKSFEAYPFISYYNFTCSFASARQRGVLKLKIKII